MRAQAVGIKRLKGAVADVATLGELVWARLPAAASANGAVHPWWPAELLDPFRLPPGRALPPHALAGASTVLCSHSGWPELEIVYWRLNSTYAQVLTCDQSLNHQRGTV